MSKHFQSSSNIFSLTSEPKPLAECNCILDNSGKKKNNPQTLKGKKHCKQAADGPRCHTLMQSTWKLCSRSPAVVSAKCRGHELPCHPSYQGQTSSHTHLLNHELLHSGLQTLLQVKKLFLRLTLAVPLLSSPPYQLCYGSIPKIPRQASFHCSVFP